MPTLASYRAVLSTNLPGRTETLLLQTCLAEADQSRRAWARLAADGADVSELLTRGGHGMRRLAPLLYEAVRRNGLDADSALLTRCRMASMREGLRARAFAGVIAAVFDALEAAGIPFIVLKGAALAEPIYGDPVLRHSHDLELLVREEDIHRAAEALRAVSCAGTEPLRAGGKLRVFHASGLPVVLRTRLFEPALYGGDWAWCAERTVMVSVADRVVRTLSPALALFHVCVHAAYGHGRSSLQWVTDALMLVRRGADPECELHLDWRQLTSCVQRFNTALPLSTALTYLREQLRADVPDWVMQSVDREALDSSTLEREVALRCVWWGRPRHFVRALQAKLAPWERVGLALRIAVPSPSYAAYRLGAAPSLRVLATYYGRRATRQTLRALVPFRQPRWRISQSGSETA